MTIERWLRRPWDLTVLELFKGIGRPVNVKDVPFKGATADSREECKGKVFFALKGRRFDGHMFAEEAMRKGAVCAVVERPVGDIPQIVVESTLRALIEIAKRRIKAISPRTFCITGSAGKTTTKEMLFLILSETYKCGKTVENQNNLIGVPLNILNTPENIEIFVAELGTNAFGEIERLSEICSPHVGIITSIGESHLEGLESVERVFQEKVSMVKYTKEALLFPSESPFAEKAKLLCRERGIEFVPVPSEENQVKELFPGRYLFKIKGKEYELEAPFAGEHMGKNALFALVAVSMEGIEVEKGMHALKKFKAISKRFVVKRLGRVTLVDDTYNANPVSTKAALRWLERQRGKRLFIFADMLELGRESEKLHREIGSFAKGKVEFLVAMGDMARYTFEEFVRQGGRGIWCKNHQEVLEKVNPLIEEFDIILVKGSRGMRMERVTEEIERCFGNCSTL